MSYIAIQHLTHDQFGYLVVEPATQRALGGVGANYYRPWVFPLYTPAGLTVLQEFPFDHPFHNGLWVAQGPVQMGERTIHFWPMPPERRPGEPLFTHMGRMAVVGQPTIAPHATGVCFTLQIRWLAGDGTPVLDEIRIIHLYALAPTPDQAGADQPNDGDATVCDMISVKQANYGALTFPATKFGSICVRAEPRLLPLTCGEILADGDRRGNAEVAYQQASRYVAFEGGAGAGRRFGLLLSVPGERPDAWFVRDYGAASYNPTFAEPVECAEGETWRVHLRVIAYDGTLNAARAHHWLDAQTPGESRTDDEPANHSSSEQR